MVSLCALFGTAGCNHGTTSSSDSTGGSSSEPAQTGNYIAYDGSSDYTILLPESPQPAESTAATELSTILGQVTGATIDVVAENRARDVSTEGNFISVGETQLYKEQEFKAENLNTDGFLIKTVDNTLFIIGENQRGTLYGVYEFLEREAGCRFLSPTYDHIPSVQRLGLRELDITEIPTFATRSDFYWPMSYDTLYTAKMRYLSQFSGFKDLSESIGGSLTTYWNETGHSYYQFVPHTTYYAQHPDWFSGPDANNSQPCFSSGLNNDGTIAEGESFMSTLIEAVKQKILDEPMLTHIMLGQMDNDNVCRCERCTAQIEALGGQRSAQLVLVTNAVAREVKEWMQEEGMDRGYGVPHLLLLVEHERAHQERTRTATSSRRANTSFPGTMCTSSSRPSAPATIIPSTIRPARKTSSIFTGSSRIGARSPIGSMYGIMPSTSTTISPGIPTSAC